MPSIDTVFGIRNHPTVAPLHQADPFDPFRTVRIGIVMFTREVELAWLQHSDLRRDVLKMQLKLEATKPDPEARGTIRRPPCANRLPSLGYII